MTLNSTVVHTAPRQASSYLPLFLLIGVALFVLMPGTSAPFISTGEPREAVVAQSMILEHDLTHAVRYADDLATKPPLLHWLIVLCSSIAGEISETTSRFPSIIAALSILASWGLLVSSIMSPSIGILTGTILLTSSEWLRHAALTRVDMLLAANTNFALICLFLWLKRKRSLFLIVASLPLALAALTKGPIGVALPIVLAGLLLTMRRTLTIRSVISLTAVTGFALLPLFAWYMAQNQASDGTSWQIFISENVDRLLGRMAKGDDPHLHGPFYLLGTLFTGLLPWTLIGLAPLLLLIKERRAPKSYLQTLTEPQKELVQFAVVTVLVWFIFYLIPSSKRGVYLLPAYPAAALLLALFFAQFEEMYPRLLSRLCTVFTIVLAILWSIILLFRLSPFFLNMFISSEKTLREVTFYWNVLSLQPSELSLTHYLIIFAPLIVLGGLLFMRSRDKISSIRLGAVSLLTVYVAVKVQLILPVSKTLSPEQAIAELLSNGAPKELSLANQRMYAQVFYLRKRFKYLRLVPDEDSTALALGVMKIDSHPDEPVRVSRSAAMKPDRHLYLKSSTSHD